MGRTSFTYPLDSLVGKFKTSRENGYAVVHRQRRIGTDANGKPIYDGVATYQYTLHQGEWSPGAVANRQLFQQAQRQARKELKDPERLAYWTQQHREHLLSLKSGEKRYGTLLGFTSSRIHAILKSAQQPSAPSPYC